MFRSLRTVAIVGAAVLAAVSVGLAVIPAAASPAPTPTISSFSPTSAPVGTLITIEGSNLSGATGVDFNLSVPAPVTVNSSTEVTTTVPLGDDDGPITVTTPGGTATSSSIFTLVGFYVATTTLPDARPGYSYSDQLQAAGGIAPFRWTHSGALPKGMVMTRTGWLTGVPNLKKALPGVYTINVRVSDKLHGHRVWATKTLTLTVDQPT
jgi:hypothetical protein